MACEIYSLAPGGCIGLAGADPDQITNLRLSSPSEGEELEVRGNYTRVESRDLRRRPVLVLVT